MTQFIYAYRDRKLGGFVLNALPVDTLEPDKVKISLERFMKSCNDPQKLSAFLDKEFYLLGQFNDETGFIASKVEYLIDVDSLARGAIELLTLKTEDNEDGN